MSRALNKFKQYASAGAAAIATPKPKPGAGETQMQKVASMLIHIIERTSTDLPDRHRGLPEKLTKEIRDSFNIIDTDNDGLATREQIERLVYRIDPEMTEDEMLDLLETADLDADGMYDMDEYLFLMYLKWNDQESVDDIKEAFKVFDKDNSGALSRDEFAFILRKLGEPLTDFEVDEILNHFDRDGSGEIDFDEFAYVMTGPHLDDEGKDATGIPLTKGQSLPNVERLGPVRRVLSTSISGTNSINNLAELAELEMSVKKPPPLTRRKNQIKADVVVERREKSESGNKKPDRRSSGGQSSKSAKKSSMSMASAVISQLKKA